MEIEVTELTGKEEIKRAMLATQGLKMVSPNLRDSVYEVQLLGRHSTLEGRIFNILLTGVSERVHTHIIRHEEIGKYVSTARPDWSDGSTQNSRMILLRIPTNRLLEIMNQRLCGAAWLETRKVFYEIREKIGKIDSILYNYLVAPCVLQGRCTEPRSYCGYITSTKYLEEKIYLDNKSKELVNMFN